MRGQQTMSKQKYKPHRHLKTQVVPSKTDYNREQNRYSIEDYLSDMDDTNDPDSVKAQDEEEFVNAEGEFESAQDMFEHGFHIEIPEN
jgi:hypothetical protein